MDGEEIPERISVLGRGGTNFRSIFNWIEENARGSHLIYATDGFGTFPSTKEAGEVIWLLSKKHLEVLKFPFGSCVKV
jgi:predicted metal-dependent peptidase